MEALDDQFLAGTLNLSDGPLPLAEKSTPNMQASEQLEKSKSSGAGKLLNECSLWVCITLKLYHFPTIKMTPDNFFFQILILFSKEKKEGRWKRKWSTPKEKQSAAKGESANKETKEK